MLKLKNIFVIFSILISFLGYSYYNYHKREKAVNAVEEYRQKNNLIQIFNLNQSHFNIFDKLSGNKSQSNYLFVNASNYEKYNDNKYQIHCSQWVDANNLETLVPFDLKRTGDTFNIVTYDLFLSPIAYDTIISDEINGKIFEIIDNWVKINVSNK